MEAVASHSGDTSGHPARAASRLSPPASARRSFKKVPPPAAWGGSGQMRIAVFGRGLRETATRARTASRRFARSAARRSPAAECPRRRPTSRIPASTASRDPDGTGRTATPAAASADTGPLALPSSIASTRSGRSETTFSALTSSPPTRAIACASGGKSEYSDTPTREAPAPTAKTISVRLGASVTTRAGGPPRAAGGGTGPPRSQPAGSTHASARARRRRANFRPERNACGRELPLGLGLVEVVGYSQAHAGGVVHLPRGLLRVLQLGQAVLDLRQLLLDLLLELRDLAPGHRHGVLVELFLIPRKTHRTS